MISIVHNIISVRCGSIITADYGCSALTATALADYVSAIGVVMLHINSHCRLPCRLDYDGRARERETRLLYSSLDLDLAITSLAAILQPATLITLINHRFYEGDAEKQPGAGKLEAAKTARLQQKCLLCLLFCY